MLNVYNILLFNEINETSILFTSYVDFLEQYLVYYVSYSLFNLKGSKSKVTKLTYNKT